MGSIFIKIQLYAETCPREQDGKSRQLKQKTRLGDRSS